MQTAHLFRKKPVVIEAVQWDGTAQDALRVMRHFGQSWEVETATMYGKVASTYLVIPTLEDGPHTGHFASAGDWIIKGVKGEFCPCKPDIFTATYEPAASQPAPSEDTARLDWLGWRSFRYDTIIKKENVIGR